jgi:hydrogenase-4 component B
MTGSPPALPEPVALILLALFLAGFSGVPGLFPRYRGGAGQRIAASLLLAGSVCGVAGALGQLLGNRTDTCTLSWTLPFGAAECAVDPLSALFLLPIFIIASCSSLYGTGYWPGARHRASEPKLSFFTGTITAAMAGIVLARNSALFLIAWEIMALSCYFLMSVEDEKPAVREAAIFYLITTHIGTLGLFAMFALVKGSATSFLFPAAGTLDAASPLAGAVFLTALFGFGLKAGLMPLHVWLPSAHANAPSHISALMSGVLIKMGIYGIIRILSFFDRIPLWWGITVLAAGLVSGVVGVAFAIGQHDLKRLLAYHSIENIGIIAMGIGTALIGRSLGHQELILLGLAGALLHVLNHATFKALLFLTAGAAIHAAGTREIDLMGGLIRRTPWSAFFFLVGAVAICGLPPLNGFVSELLVYLGLFHGVIATKDELPLALIALAIPALALIGGLATACFVKVYGVAFLGLPRSGDAAGGHEACWRMRAPMALLALVCVGIGLFPLAMAPLLQNAVRCWQPAEAVPPLLSRLAPLSWMTPLGLILITMMLLLWWHFRRRLAAEPTGTTGTWDCGYALPTPRMQYTASSFAELLVKLFSGVLRPHGNPPAITGPYPPRSQFASHVPEAVLECLYLPFCAAVNRQLSLLRRLQHGQLHLYILYIFITLVLLLIWAR